MVLGARPTAGKPSGASIFQGKAGAAIAAIAIALVATACSPSVQTGPPRLYTVDNELTALRTTYGVAMVERYNNAATPAQKLGYRNSIILGRMYAIDLAYGRYEARLTQERQQVPFVATVTSIALSGTGVLIADTTTKSVLAAIDTGLKGSVEAYEKDILVQKTIDILQTAMQTNRARIRSDIISRLDLSVAQYPLELGLSDVERYYRAGTLTGGFLTVTEASASELKAAKENELSTIDRFGADNATTKIRNYLRANGADGRTKVRLWLKAKGVNATTTALLNKQQYATLRAELVRDFGL
ncbi:hypothetical protein [Nitratireductor sp. XY-223]|uniref:hypothetical protein n=1 Tax=Nitratireductor sp. XY-223 TaxID=2561926 RepID=UPI0010AA3B3D|nr:hypothetical protein [Nitratireductor sp. XY-223]